MNMQRYRVKRIRQVKGKCFEIDRVGMAYPPVIGSSFIMTDGDELLRTTRIVELDVDVAEVCPGFTSRFQTASGSVYAFAELLDHQCW